MKIDLRGFTGEVPRTEPYYLDETNAVSSVDAAMRGGSLTPFRQNSTPVHVFPSNRLTIHQHEGEWLGWNADADVVPGPVAQDRLYISYENAEPQLRVDGQYLNLHLPTPNARPTLTRNGQLDTDIADYVVYAFTWVTSYGEESAPSPVSPSILWSPGCTITVSNLPGTPPANRGVVFKRIYRSVTGSTGATDMFFVAEVPATDVSYVHDAEVAPIAEALPTAEFAPVPKNLRGLTALPNGMMAGFAGKELYFCEPYQPHAWPVKYRLTMNDYIIGLAAFGTSMAVLTTGQPQTVQGMHPEQMVAQEVEQPFPCVAKRGIVDMGYAAVFPSTDGLVLISQSGGRLVTQGLWTREQWQALNPRTFAAARVGNYYLFTCSPADGSGRMTAMLDPNAQQPTLMQLADNISSIYTEIATGTTYVLDASRQNVRVFDDPAAKKRQYRWKSKPFQLPYARAFGAMRLDAVAASGEGVTTRIYADGKLFATLTAINRAARLPAGEHTNWQIELTGDATVLQLTLAQTLGELNQ